MVDDISSEIGCGLLVDDMISHIKYSDTVSFGDRLLKIDSGLIERCLSVQKKHPELFQELTNISIDLPDEYYDGSQSSYHTTIKYFDNLIRAILITRFYEAGLKPEFLSENNSNNKWTWIKDNFSIIPVGKYYIPDNDKTKNGISFLKCSSPFINLIIDESEFAEPFEINVKKSLESLTLLQNQSSRKSDYDDHKHTAEWLTEMLLTKHLAEKGFYFSFKIQSTRAGYLVADYGGMKKDKMYLIYGDGLEGNFGDYDNPLKDPGYKKLLTQIKNVLVGKKHSGFEILTPIFDAP
jgi:hypothetical protein